MNKNRQSSLRNALATSVEPTRVALARRMFLETLEDRRLMTHTPWSHAGLPLDSAEALTPAPLVAEGEGELVAVRLGVKNLDGSNLNPAEVQTGASVSVDRFGSGPARYAPRCVRLVQ